ncbi:hypothetical protein M406DRAFT_225273, partial [Cryphonectria parasitica EP155]
FFVNHMFLPPKLPQENDYDPNLDKALLRLVAEALTSLTGSLPSEQRSDVKNFVAAVSCQIRSHNANGAVDGAKLLEAFGDLRDAATGTAIPLHIIAQNAGVIISKRADGIDFEAFELSASNHAVMSTQGRLRRCFPGPALTIETCNFEERGLQVTIAETLSKMSSQKDTAMMPVIQKSKNDIEEIRDTMHPGHVTELLISFLMPFSKPSETSRVWKNVRDEVLWKSTHLPWRRSPLWLHLRVVMQLLLTRSRPCDDSMKSHGACTYKLCLLHILATVLQKALRLGHSIQLDLLHCMSAKIVRRMHKLNFFDDQPGTDFIKSVLETTDVHVSRRWMVIQQHNAKVLDLTHLASLEFDKDLALSLPELDTHLSQMSTRASTMESSQFIPVGELVTFFVSEFPSIDFGCSPEYTVYNLSGLEGWVSQHLTTWLEDKLNNVETCSALRTLMEEYHRETRNSDKNNPERKSIMFLTLLEIWVALDQSAIAQLPMLADYDPRIPYEQFQCFIMPKADHLFRLRHVENYIKQRVAQATYGSPGSIFMGFGTENSYSVRHYNRSSEHQDLRHQIEVDATEQRRRKLEELVRKQQEHKDLMRRHDALDHEYYQRTDRWGETWSDHSAYCGKCSYRRDADNIGITIHEWPLPTKELDVKSVVFELHAPPAFCTWRDATMFLIQDVLGSEYATQSHARAEHPLAKYQALQDYFHSYSKHRRIGLLSETKPHVVTHRNLMFSVDTVTSDRICLHNGLRLRYFDEDLDMFVVEISHKDAVLKACTYSLPSESSALERFLLRRFQGKDSTPNEVIAAQSECPEHLSLAEFRALASIPVGYRLQWMNILGQIKCPILDLKKVEASLVVLQAIYQAGPPEADDYRRSGHRILADHMFAVGILNAVEEAATRIEENWESMTAMGVLVSVVVRLLSLTPLTPGRDISEQTLGLLSRLRKIVFSWVQILVKKFEDSKDSHQRSQFRTKVVEAALVCCQTFDVDEPDFREVIRSSKNASILIQCSILIHDHYSAKSASKDSGLTHILHRRWQETSYQVYKSLACMILRRDTSTCLDSAVKASWPEFERGNQWQTAEGTEYWVVSKTVASEGRQLAVHYNLVTGQLMVDGAPLSRLPFDYESHVTFIDLFDNEIFEIVPSRMHAMRFSSKRTYMDHSLHFGKHGNHLLIRALRDSITWELLPRSLFDGRLPQFFLDEFFHWYNTSTGVVELRVKNRPWSSDNCWQLKSTSGQWFLERQGRTLVNPQSDTGRALALVFSSLQGPSRINLTLLADRETLEIELPRLQMDFSLKKGSTSVLSRKQRGFEVDTSQSFGTLIGLKSKLVLKDLRSHDRKVLIPDGTVIVAPDGDHSSVSIATIATKPTSPHVFGVNELLQKLTDTGGLRSKLFLCYLHGLTSSCLPDPLTVRTGTEQSLSILKGAAVCSFENLSSQDLEILQQIDSLTPRRKFYPEHLCVMQTVEWNERIPILSQHSYFHVAVQKLFKQARMAKIYFPDRYVEPPLLEDVHPGLLKRDLVRSSSCRVSRFGAEESNTNLDATYSSRDMQQSSERAKQAQFISDVLFRKDYPQLCQALSQSRLGERIWDTFQTVGSVKGVGANTEISEDDLAYDAKWLINHPKYWAEIWCWMHEHAQDGKFEASSQCFRLMMWFATMAYAPEAALHLIHTAAAMFIHTGTKAISMNQLPSETASYSLTEGEKVVPHKVEAIISNSFRPLQDCPEGLFSHKSHETHEEYRNRQDNSYRWNRDRASTQLLEHVERGFPSPMLSLPSGSLRAFLGDYMDFHKATRDIQPLYKIWHDNHLFKKYLLSIEEVINQQPSSMPLNIQTLQIELPDYSPTVTQGYIGTADVFGVASPGEVPDQPRIPSDLLLLSGSHLDLLIERKLKAAKSTFEGRYALKLRQSQIKWKQDSGDVQQCMLRMGKDLLQSTLRDHVLKTKNHMESLRDSMVTSIRSGLKGRSLADSLHHSPRLSSVFFLHQLSENGWEDGDGWSHLPAVWRPWIVAYGIAVTEFQRAERLLRSVRDQNQLIQELQNEGHTNWDPMKYPESLLIEVESDFLVRSVQEDIAEKMRSPPHGQNTVMQLNMGEGKSSVIVPIVAAALANGHKLVRVIVAKPQSRQMLRMLVSKLGGLLNRRIFHLPFSRSLQLTKADAQNILHESRLCMNARGVMLVQPEHILSFKLMGLESFISDRETIGRSLVQTQDFFDNNTRDIVDESDENFSTKFELIYTMGTQSLIDFAPDRWIVTQTVLGVIRDYAPKVKEMLPLSIEVSARTEGGFPRVRIIEKKAMMKLLEGVALHICTKGFSGFPISRQEPHSRKSVLRYITQKDLSLTDKKYVEDSAFWTDTTKSYILLLRGLFAKGILAFIFGQKRWRVNYGLDKTRRPSTRLAVPYRAKDSPSPRSEFSHPDVTIGLTSLCYYYQGLDDKDLFQTFSHLLESDQATQEFGSWLKDSHGLAHGFRQLMGINLKDTVQCKTEVFPSFRYAKRTIDYFLQHIVFSKQMKEFPKKLSASGWDLAVAKTHPTTGFSGTIDSAPVLPLQMHYLDLPDQEGTNAQVLNYLLGPENKVLLLSPPAESSDLEACGGSQPTSDAETLLTAVTGQMDSCLRVILDVGAQIIELTNLEVARNWLSKVHEQDQSVQAAIYFDDNDEMMVLNNMDITEAFWTSPYVDQLDTCLVFLDEAHTRGIDLRLPGYYKAAVTLGANLTKDRLVQACMRMRKLGKGQSVVFCVPPEIQTKIREATSGDNDQTRTVLHNSNIGVEDVIDWAMSETTREIKNSISLWAVQGRRFVRQQFHEEAARTSDGIKMTAEIAEEFLEDEAQTIEHRYRPLRETPSDEHTRHEGSMSDLAEIEARCRDFGPLNANNATLEEEQERELSPEIEEERQIERPPPAEAAEHEVHPHVTNFAAFGKWTEKSSAFLPAFEALQDTSAAIDFDPSLFPRDIMVTADFARTVQKSATGHFLSDAYQRPVNWILTSQPKNWNHVVIISPHEAQELLPLIQTHKKTTLHIYCPRPSPEIRSLDDLNFYTVPSSSLAKLTPFPLHLKTQLNLFAGQLYLKSELEYLDLCTMLRLSPQEAVDGTIVEADGFIQSSTSTDIAAVIKKSTFTSSPVRFLKSFLTKARRDCQLIDKTHLGRILDGALLQTSDF